MSGTAVAGPKVRRAARSTSAGGADTTGPLIGLVLTTAGLLRQLSARGPFMARCASQRTAVLAREKKCIPFSSMRAKRSLVQGAYNSVRRCTVGRGNKLELSGRVVEGFSAFQITRQRVWEEVFGLRPSRDPWCKL